MFEHLRFLVMRTFYSDQLVEFSAPLEDLVAELAGKHIAIIGNSRALGDFEHGASIDRADIVIRINRAPMPAPLSHGTKTNWLALATRLSKPDTERIRPERILWMSPKRKRLSFGIAKTRGFYLFPLKRTAKLQELLGAPPTTGLMVIDLVAGSDAASVCLYGFDFFASLSLSGTRTSAQVPHDFLSEKTFVERLCDKDPRVRIIR